MIFSEDGVLPVPMLTEAVTRMSKLINATEVQALGLGNYLTEFIPNLASITGPLRNLIKKIVAGNGIVRREAYIRFKESVCNPPILFLFDPSKQILIYCDASKDGIVCCLLQDNKLIAYASRSLKNKHEIVLKVVTFFQVYFL